MAHPLVKLEPDERSRHAFSYGENHLCKTTLHRHPRALWRKSICYGEIISRSKISWRKSIFYGENYSAAGRRFVMEIIFWRLLDVAWPLVRGGVGRVRREPTARVRAPYGAARLPDNGSVARSR